MKHSTLVIRSNFTAPVMSKSQQVISKRKTLNHKEVLNALVVFVEKTVKNSIRFKSWMSTVVGSNDSSALQNAIFKCYYHLNILAYVIKDWQNIVAVSIHGGSSIARNILIIHFEIYIEH